MSPDFLVVYLQIWSQWLFLFCLNALIFIDWGGGGGGGAVEKEKCLFIQFFIGNLISSLAILIFCWHFSTWAFATINLIDILQHLICGNKLKFKLKDFWCLFMIECSGDYKRHLFVSSTLSNTKHLLHAYKYLIYLLC